MILNTPSEIIQGLQQKPDRRPHNTTASIPNLPSKLKNIKTSSYNVEANAGPLYSSASTTSHQTAQRRLTTSNSSSRGCEQVARPGMPSWVGRCVREVAPMRGHRIWILVSRNIMVNLFSFGHQCRWWDEIVVLGDQNHTFLIMRSTISMID